MKYSSVLRPHLLPLYLLIGLYVLSFSNCQNNPRQDAHKWSIYLTGTQEKKTELLRLFTTLEEQQNNPEGKYIIIQEIIKIMRSTGELDQLNFFLTNMVESDPQDPFNAYYLFIVAQNYQFQGASSFAGLYFERIINNYPDLLVQEQSIHLTCLTNLITLENDPEIKILHHRDLISRFSDKINNGPAYFHLAKTYEELGAWEQAIQAYQNFLKYPEQKIPGHPEAHTKVREMIAFYQYRNKNWPMDTLDDLVANIQRAIRTRNASMLNQYRARVNFFAISWEEEKSEPDQDFLAGLGTFLNPRVSYARNIDRASNNREAYLRTQGWEHRISTWYLYFRRIHFPADPAIHGQWEWAGIYLGEKPFAGSGRSY